jgi:hypothetical protein
MISQSSLYPIEIKDHPQVQKWRRMEHGTRASQLVEHRIRIAPHLFGKKIGHTQSPSKATRARVKIER